MQKLRRLERAVRLVAFMNNALKVYQKEVNGITYYYQLLSSKSRKKGIGARRKELKYHYKSHE